MIPKGGPPFDNDRCLTACQAEAEGTGVFEPNVARFLLQYVADRKDDPQCALYEQGYGWLNLIFEPQVHERLPEPAQSWTKQCMADWLATCPKQFENKSNPTREALELCLIRYSRFRDPVVRRRSEDCFKSASCRLLGECSAAVEPPPTGGSLPWY